MFSDALDKLGTIIDKEDASLSSIPDALAAISKDVGTVITKLKELDIVLNQCLEEDPNITQMDINSIVATTDNFVGVMTNEELNALLNTPPEDDLITSSRLLPSNSVPGTIPFSLVT